MSSTRENPWLGNGYVAVIGHRFAGGEAPPNTLYALRHAMGAGGAHILETDVRITSFSVDRPLRPVVMAHDADLAVETDISGKLSDLPLETVCSANAAHNWRPVRKGRRLSRGRFPLRLLGAKDPALRIPTLEQLLDEATLPIWFDPKDDLAVQPLVLALREAERTNGVIIGSFSEKRVHMVRKYAPEVRTSATVSEAKEFIRTALFNPKQQRQPNFDVLQIPVVAPHALAMTERVTLHHPHVGKLLAASSIGPLGSATRKVIRQAHKFGVAVFPWTIDHPGQLAYLLDVEADARPDGICTNVPSVLRDMLDDRRMAWTRRHVQRALNSKGRVQPDQLTDHERADRAG